MTTEEAARPLPSLRIYPNPVLTAPAAEVAAITDEIRQLAGDLLRAMAEWAGAGLAAPQIGVPLRVLALATTRHVAGREVFDPMCLVNPRIVGSSDETDVQEEGCLSLPGVKARVRRPVWVEVETLQPDGTTSQGRFVGPVARVVQHEIDHLDGVLLLDRLEPDARKAAMRELRRILDGDLVPAHDRPPGL